MEDFEFVSPTHFVFGHNAESKVGPMLAERGARKVLLHYGGQSAIKSGLIDRVCASLEQAGIEYVKLGGVRPNPEIGLVREGVALCKENGVDWVLAVGGGSVVDSAKAIANGACIDTTCGSSSPRNIRTLKCCLSLWCSPSRQPAAKRRRTPSSATTSWA